MASLPLQSITWDISTKSEAILVHDLLKNNSRVSDEVSNYEKKKSITCTSHKGWKSIFSAENFSVGKSTHIFRIDDNSGGCLIGIASDNFSEFENANSYCGCDDFSWGLQSDSGYTFHKTIYRPYVGRPLQTGDIIEMSLDLDHGTLGFVISGILLRKPRLYFLILFFFVVGVDYGVAFSRLPKKQNFYVCVSLSGENTTLSILSPF